LAQRSEPRRGAAALGAPLAVGTTRAVSIMFSNVYPRTRPQACGRVWCLTARVVSDRGSTGGSKARDAPPLHDARRRRGDRTRRRRASGRATLALAHLEPSFS